MSREEITRLLEEDVFTVFAEKTDYVDTNNGMLNEGYIANRKKLFFKKAVEYLTDEVVTTRQEYPINDVSEVNMKVDLVVMKKRDLDAILTYIHNHE